MKFAPRFCPQPACPSFSSGHFRLQRKGFFRRSCDGRSVQRFLCKERGRYFSVQTFRLDYRLHKPHLSRQLLPLLVSKVTHRQTARVLSCSRKTVAHRLDLLGRHCREFQAEILAGAAASGGIGGTFQLDELETFEHSRRLAPVTVPVLIEKSSYFVLYTEAAALPSRGGLSPDDRERRALRELIHGKRRSGSRDAVRRCFDVLRRLHAPGQCARVQTDCKGTYSALLKRAFEGRLLHERHPSRAKRDYKNPLFPINHTLAMLRDGISRLVRRTWAASKLRSRLAKHLWIWIVWRNFVRGITNRAPRVTPAMALGIARRRLRREEILTWRIFRLP